MKVEPLRALPAALAALAALAVLLPAAPARAQSPDATELLRRGVEARVGGRDEEARGLFEQAWARCRCPEALAQMALAEQALGRWADAERHLANAAGNPGDPWIARNRAEIDDALRDIAAHLGTLEVRTNVAGATVRVAGREPTAPGADGVVRLRVEPGQAVVRAEAGGYEPVTRPVSVDAGGVTRLSLEFLPPIPPPPPALPPPPGSSPVLTPGGGTAAGRAGREGHDGAGRRARDAAIALTAAGGATATATAVAWGYEQARVRAYNDDTRCLVGSRSRQENCGGLLSDAWAGAGAAVGAAALTAAAAAGSAWLWQRAWRGPGALRAVRAAAWLNLGGGAFAAGVGGEF